MDIIRNAEMGGMDCLLTEAMPACSSSTQIFANAPAGTRAIQLTLRTQGITMRCDAGTATASANGIDLAADTAAPHLLALTYDQALKVRAIQISATATGYIQYWGKK